MKKTLLFLFVVVLSKMNSQTAQFSWMAGSTFTNQLGTYGTQGVSSITNAPGSRAYSNSWEDNAGNLWLFGGQGHATTPSLGNMNDLWKYTPSNNEWVWLSGANVINQLGIYGTKGVASGTNSPGARGGSATWVDNNGNFWMFGGAGYGSAGASGNLNDLWKYNPSTQEWTWVTGTDLINQGGLWGTKGVASSTNTPSSRVYGLSWVDNNGDLWLFGGNGRGVSGFDGLLNDLWKYNIASNEWTWVSGGNGINSIGSYGTQGVGSTSNTPGTRYGCVSWTDNAGDLWLFGGQGLGTVMTTGSLSDLWKYNIASNQWTWVKGGNITNTNGTYGSMGFAAISNLPGARYFSISWKDGANNLWLYGGNGNGASASGSLGDLWQYNISNNMWVWVAGSNAPGQAAVYGTQGVASMTNTPGGRYNACNWKDANGDLWMFSGRINTQFKNDLWKINLCNAPASPVNTSSVQAICRNELTTLSATGTGNLTWYSAAIGGSFLGNGNTYATPNLTTTTTFYVQDSTCARSIRTAVTVTVNALPTISIAGSNTVCSASNYTMTASGASTYTWNTGATTASITGNQGTTTTFSVVGTSTAGCVNFATKTLTVYATPAIAVAGNTLLCRGMGTTLTLSGANTYTWNMFNTTPTLSISSLTTTTTYTYAGKNTTGGCTQTGAVTVSVMPNPTVSIFPPSALCAGSTFTLNASGAATYTWMPGNIVGAIALVTPTASITYSVIGTAATTCTGSASAFLTVNNNPNINIVTSTSVVCAGTSVVLNGSGGSTNGYTWSTGATTFSTTVNPSVTTTYTLIGTGPNSCTNSAVKTITVNPKPVIGVAGNDVICTGSPANLILSGADTYTWNGTANPGSVTVSPAVTTTYSASGTYTATGCSQNSLVTVTVNPLPSLNISTTNTLLCAGETATLSVSGAATYTWSDSSNGTEIVVTPVSTSNYSVIGVDGNGCSNNAVFAQNVSACTGVNELHQQPNYFSVFPNPNNGAFTIQAQDPDIVTIANELGQVVGTVVLSRENQFTQHINYLESGIYFLSGKTGRSRVIVTH